MNQQQFQHTARSRSQRLTLGAALIVGAAVAAGAQPAGPSVRLGPEVRLGGYALRLPDGYRPVPFRPPVSAPPTVGLVYGAANRAGGASPLIAVTITTLPPGRPLPSAVQGLEHFQQNRVRKGQAPIVSGFERVRVNGLPFERARFTEHLLGGARAHTASGFDYVAVRGRDLICIQALDSDPSSRQTLPVMEAAARTFHKS